MKRIMIIAVVLVLTVACDLEPPQSGAAEEDDAQHLYAVLMYAQHCASCNSLDPTLRAVQGEFEEAITFLRFDMTDEDTKSASKQLAAEYDLEELYREHENRTGYLIVVTEDGEEELLRLSGAHEEAQLRAELEGVLD